MSIRVKGKLVGIHNKENRKTFSIILKETEAEIELPPVDISKIKEGDEVWIKIKLNSDKNNNIKELGYYFLPNDIIAYFPKSAEPEKDSEKEIKELNWKEKELKIIGDKRVNNTDEFIFELYYKINELVQAVNKLKGEK